MLAARWLRRPPVLASHVVLAVVFYVLSVLLINPLHPPDFDQECSDGQPYFVAASYRAQTSRNRPPSIAAPSVILFQDTPRDRVHYTLATFREVGAVWGLAYRRSEPAVYAATYHKRSLPYGPGGAGAIYRIDLKDGQVSHFLTVPNAGRQRHGGGMTDGSLQHDQAGARQVGKTALGDIDLSADESQLFVTNLADRRIYRFEMPSGKLLGSFDHGAAGEPWRKDARPFGLAFYDGYLYHGVVNSRGSGTSLVAKVYRSRPDGTGMTEVASLGLDYARDGVRLRSVTGASVKWSPWTDQIPLPNPRRSRLHNPQPMLSDITFTPDGTMVIGLRDRYWDIAPQWVEDVLVTPTVLVHPPGTPTPSVHVVAEEGLGFGDILRGERQAEGYLIVTDPEHFDDSNRLGHGESALGGLACIASTELIISTHYGVGEGKSNLVAGEEGVYWYDVPTGNKTGQEIVGQPGSFQDYEKLLQEGKVVFAHCTVPVEYKYEFYRDVGSLGDVETLCEPCSPAIATPSPSPTTVGPTPVLTTPAPPPPTTPPPSPLPTEPPTDTPTPLPPTATATPAERVLGPIYLPLVLKEECQPKRLHADVALVIDASLTMTELTRAGRPKIEAAREAARLFVARMAFPEDQAAVIAFNREAHVLQPLTGDRQAVLAALEGIRNQEFTRIDLGLKRAHEELVGPNRKAENTAAIILLTDGRSNPVPVSQAVEAAAAAKADGILVFTVGLGEDIQVEALDTMATRHEYCWIAPDGEDLGPIYQEIAGEIPCPPGLFWGGR